MANLASSVVPESECLERLTREQSGTGYQLAGWEQGSKEGFPQESTSICLCGLTRPPYQPAGSMERDSGEPPILQWLLSWLDPTPTRVTMGILSGGRAGKSSEGHWGLCLGS